MRENLSKKKYFQGGQDFFKPIVQEHRKLNFNLNNLEMIDYLPVKMQNIKVEIKLKIIL